VVVGRMFVGYPFTSEGVTNPFRISFSPGPHRPGFFYEKAP
jgi:hypothetical protein